MNDEAYLKRKLAQQSARLAAYGNVAAHTPADYTLLEALTKLGIERQQAKLPKKSKEGDEVTPVDDAATGPIFESEVDE